MRALRLIFSSALVMTGIGMLSTGGAPAAAQSTVAFRATASAEGVRTGIAASGAPVAHQVADVASPIAQAAVDSTAGSSALASVAYPGDLAITAPGLIAGFTGGQTSDLIPEYPLVAIAGSTTTPEARSDAPGTTMHARGDERSAAATASTGGNGEAAAPIPTLTTTAEIQVAEDGTVKATASSTTSSLTIGPLVLGSVTSTSKVTRAPGAEPTREATFEVAGAKVAGVDVALTEAGLVVASTGVPVSASALAPVLGAAKIEVQLIEEQVTDDGIVSGGLVLRREQDLPGAITPATVTSTFGRSAAAVSPVSLPDIRFPSAPATDAAAVAVGPVGAAPTASDTGQSPLPAAAEVPPSATPAPAPETAASAAASVGFHAGLFDLRPIYIALALAGGGAGIAIELLRHLGVLLRWT